MNITIPINTIFLQKVKKYLQQLPLQRILAVVAIALSITATIYAYRQDVIITYGDAESHLDIAKRVVNGLTPGIAQLGGIWLPLPHLLMVPLVYFDPLWRTGFAGSIVSGICFVISAVFIYKLCLLLTKDTGASLIAFLVFALNPNMLYMQATPMTELPLIIFFILSSYYFIKNLYQEADYFSLILAAFFGFCATLSRYDGWFLVGIEATIIFLRYIWHKKKWERLQGRLILFATLAFFGVILWLLWDQLILGDALYFTHSQFSANAQQKGWLAKGQLPAYHNIGLSFLYYFVTAMSNTGIIIFCIALVGFIAYLLQKKYKDRFYIVLLMLAPFIFYVLTLYVGQSIIFIPDLTPGWFESNLFNVRYGIMMVPFVSLFVGYLFSRCQFPGKTVVISLLIFQVLLFGIGYSRVMTLADGKTGLSQAKRPDAERWLAKHYDHGLVLLDDYSRLTSVIRSNIPMQHVIYIGTKPYWEESLSAPEKYATWIIIQKNDDVWKHIYANPTMRARLYKYFRKDYTSPDILIFKRDY